MPNVDIGRLSRVHLRKVWAHEAHDFTVWLQENLDVLNEHLDFQLVSAEREQSTGSFNVDLLAEDDQGQTVVIENQLERTDHDHLGKLITYLAAFDADTAIWIASEPRAEHVKAVSWLNDSSPASFYLFRVEAVQIGDSPPAPLITPIVGPTIEGKRVASQKKEKSEVEAARYAYWTALLGASAAKSRLFSGLSPSRGPYIQTGAGMTGLSYSYWINKTDARIQFWIDRGKGQGELNNSLFDQLAEHRDQIDEVAGATLTWDRMPDSRGAKVVRELPGMPGYSAGAEEWESSMPTMVDAMEAFHRALDPHLKSLDI